MSVKSILIKRGFFENVLDLSNIVKPIKDAIVCLEGRASNLANCFHIYIKLALAINNISIEFQKNFRNYCITKFNNRYKEFDFDEYILSYFLHPGYRGNLNLLLFIILIN